jgi:CBS domain-containing protein
MELSPVAETPEIWRCAGPRQVVAPCEISRARIQATRGDCRLTRNPDGSKIASEDMEPASSSIEFGGSEQGRSVMKVKDAMHKGVEWVGPETPIAELARLMRDQDVGSIPIGENDRLVGMVTDRDIVCKGLAEDGFDARKATARDVMTAGIHCCREDDDLAKAVRHMEDLKVRRLPVINKKMRMVGMLSVGDVGQSAPIELVSDYVRSVSAHHH